MNITKLFIDLMTHKATTTLATYLLKPLIKYFDPISCSQTGFLTMFFERLTDEGVKWLIKVGSRLLGSPAPEDLDGRNRYLVNGVAVTLDSIARFGVRKPLVTSRPLMVVWNFTNLCNLRCKHCYQDASRRHPNELSVEEKLDLVDMLCRDRVPLLAFSGGEPLAAPEFFEVAEYAANRGLFVSIATNGTLITEEVAKRLKKLGVNYVQVSVDAATPSKHDLFRGIPGAWELAIRGVKNLVKYGIFTCIAMTVTRFNVDEVPKVVELAKKLHVPRVALYNFIPVGKGAEIVKWDLSPIERERLLYYILREFMKGGIEVMTTAPQYGRVIASLLEKYGYMPKVAAAHFYSGSSEWGKVVEFIGGCGAGRVYLGIEPDGTVTPCVFLKIPVGNVRQLRIRDIWMKSQVLWDLRDRDKLRDPCGSCPYKHVCGGCRARAYAYFQDYLAPDPGCFRASKYL